MLESLDTVISLLKTADSTSELDSLARLAKAYHLLSDLESLQNPFIRLIKDRVNQQYEVFKNGHIQLQAESTIIDPVEPEPEQNNVVQELQQTLENYSRDELREDICRVVHMAQKPITIKEIHQCLASKYGAQETTRALISQITSQLGSWSWHAAHWWRPDYLERAVYKAGNNCIAANAPDIDRSVYYVHWSPQGYVAKIRSYLSNFKKATNHINGIEVESLLKLAEVNMDLGHFTELFNGSNLVFVIVDGAFYHRQVVAQFKVDYNPDTKVYSVDYEWSTPQHFETTNANNLVTYLFSTFAFLGQQSRYQAVVVKGDPQLLPADVSLLITDGLALKPKRSISKLPKV